MKKFIKKVLVFIIFLFGILKFINFIMYDDIHSYTRLMFKEMYEYNGNIDIVFLGSSHVYRSYDTEITDKIFKKNTFNAGSSSQLLNGSYYVLKEILRNNNLKTVYLDTYVKIDSKAENSAGIESYILTDYMKNGWNKYKYLWEIDGIDAIVSDLFPVMHSKTYSIKNIKIKLEGEYKKGNYSYVTYPNEEYRGNGFVYSFENKKEPISDYEINKEKTLSDFSYENLCKIVALCKKNNINLVLVSSPMPDEMLSKVKNYQVYIDYLKDFAIKNDIEYHNYNLCKKEYMVMDENDYKDDNHLNGIGAEKFSEKMSNIEKMLDYGEKTYEDIFYDTYEEKLKNNADNTLK